VHLDSIKTSGQHSATVVMPRSFLPWLKGSPAWLRDVWAGARQALTACSTWLVCGYSLPTYDRAITQLVADAGTADTLTRIVLMDPCATELAPRWQAVAPNAKLHLLPGLPEALRPLFELEG
jgi:hypothetical protein